ncbi:MAG TPA: FGGY family carbohydrate kinase, partial [Ardenticatenaceae bacterium]|nr:FGGY family carbohydrate kinase [Ardenticatenaceae bacterium]
MLSLLGIDLGTSSVKVLLVGRDGRVLGRGSAEYPIDHPHPNWAEQDPDAWWQATISAVRQALAQAPSAAVSAIGLSGQMHGTVLLGQDGRPLGPAIIWPDQRSHRQVEEITALVGAERLVEITGSPVATGFQAATTRWFQQEQPDLWRQVRMVLLPKDELRRRLTPSYATDPSDASSALLLDVHRREWSGELLDALDLDAAILPPVRESAAVAGELVAAAATVLGLPRGIPIVVGAGDTPAGLLGAGIVSPDTLLLTISTGGQVVVPAPTVQLDRKGRIHTFCAALPPGHEHPGWYLMGATLSAGLALRWLRDQL